MFRRILSLFSLSALAVSLCSCASVSVSQIVSLENHPPTHRPRGIYVRPFEFEEGTVRVDREGRKLSEFERALQDRLTAELVAGLRKYLAPADGLPDAAAVPPGDYWVITGRFTRINQGSRALRSMIGFGAGGTKLEVTATVSDHSSGESKPFVLIQTTGGSNAMPGAVMGIIAWPMVLQGAQGCRHPPNGAGDHRRLGGLFEEKRNGSFFRRTQAEDEGPSPVIRASGRGR
jgi:hypothetical protein